MGADNDTMKSELQKLYDLIKEMDIAMLVTRRPDGHLNSRAMDTQKFADGADLWFCTSEGEGKLKEIEADPHVNLSYYNSKSREWISVSGLAKISRDRAKIRELFQPDWQVWFPKEGDPRHGTVDDPRIVLIGVDVYAAVFLQINEPRPVVLYEVAKGWLTGTMPDVGEMHRV
jgi:general stress protein 26